MNTDVTEMFDKCNDFKTRVRLVSTFYFIALHTQIPHDELIEVLCKLVETTRRRIDLGTKRVYTVQKSSKNPTFDSDKVN